MSLLTGSACHWNFCATGFAVGLLKTEAVKSSGCEFLPAAAVAVPVVVRFRMPCRFWRPVQ